MSTVRGVDDGEARSNVQVARAANFELGRAGFLVLLDGDLCNKRMRTSGLTQLYDEVWKKS
jgi:hypothetical protein